MKGIPSYKLMRVLRKRKSADLRIVANWNYLQKFDEAFQQLIPLETIHYEEYRNNNKDLYKININNFKDLQNLSSLQFKVDVMDNGELECKFLICEQGFSRQYEDEVAVITLEPSSCKEFILSAIKNDISSSISYGIIRHEQKQEKKLKKKLLNKIIMEKKYGYHTFP